MTHIVIEAEHVRKRFRIPLDHGGTLLYRLSHPISGSRYRDFLALDDVSFTVSAGEFVGIAGPNGGGKSTLLKILSRIYAADDGRVVTRGRLSPFLELGVGFKMELSARENIFLGGAVLGVTHRELAKRVDAVLEFAELSAFGEQKLKNFSSGMVVRLAFSVAMLANAEILLMDEVLAVGDASFQQRCFEVFSLYKRQNRTVVLVSHDLSSLEAYCDRVILLRDGRIEADGAPAEVVAEYRRFVGSLSDSGQSVAADLANIPEDRRRGGRQVEITLVKLLREDGQPHHTFATGDTLTVVVEYKCNTSVDELVCGLAVRRSDGTLLAGPNTLTSKQGLGSASQGQVGIVTYRIPAIQLLGASYFLTVAVHGAYHGNLYDLIEDVLEFRVVDDRGRPGLMDLGGAWTHAIDSPDERTQRSVSNSG